MLGSPAVNGPPSELLSRVEKDAADDTAWTVLERSHREQNDLPALWASLAELIDARPARSDLVERLVAITPNTTEDGKRLMAVLERRLAALIAAGAATDLVAACHTDLGNLWLNAFAHGDHALEHYRAAIAADRRYVRAIYAARRLLRERGELPEADRLFELEALAEPDAKRKVALLIELGHFRVRELADLARAVDAFERAHNLEPENPLATRMLAHALTEQAAANPNSDPTEVRAVVASLYFQLATVAPPEQALSYAEEALAALPTHEAALELLEEVAAKTDRADLLPTRWVQYLEQVPEGAFAAVRRRRLGLAYIENKQPMDAIRCLEPIAKRGDPEAAELLIEIYQRLGRDDDAAGAMMTTLAGLSGKGRVPILERVLHLRVDAGREHDALEVAKEILELSPSSEVALELVEEEWTRTQEYPLLKRAYARAAEAEDVSPALRKRVLLDLAALGEGAPRGSRTRHPHVGAALHPRPHRPVAQGRPRAALRSAWTLAGAGRAP
jgi:tetratricopeptide (TPR) repeat protein